MVMAAAAVLLRLLTICSEMTRSKEPIDWPVYFLAAGIVIGFSFGAACLGAWAVTAIWPSVPFWPAAVLVWLSMGLFSRTKNNASN